MRIGFALCFIFLVAASHAQSFDNVVASRRYIDCQDVSFNAAAIISGLYTRNQFDSIYQFIDYWVRKCAPMETTFRLRNILDIRMGRFSPDSITASWIESLIEYRRNLEFKQYWREAYNYSLPNDFVSEQIKLDSLSRRMASETLSDDIDEALLLEFYSAISPTFEKIKDAPVESRLAVFYRGTYVRAYRMPQTHLAFVTGLIQNYGRISVFGNRPNFGVAMGGKWLRHNFDLLLDFRAGPSKEEYSFIYSDSLITGDMWTGMYVGLEYTFDFINRSDIDVGISPGIGYDRVTALTTENDYGEDPLFLGSFNKNVGLVFKYKFGKNGGYAGLHLRYNWVDYHNPGGTQLDGQYFSIRSSIGC